MLVRKRQGVHEDAKSLFAVFGGYTVKVNGFLKDIWYCGACVLCIALVHMQNHEPEVVSSLGLMITSFNHYVLFLHAV